MSASLSPVPITTSLSTLFLTCLIFIHSLTQQIVIEHLLNSKYWLSISDISVSRTDKNPCVHGVYILADFVM